MTTSSVFCFRESGQVLWNNEIKNTYSTDRQNSTLKSEHASSGAKARTPRSKCLQLELEIWLECTSHTVLWGDTQDCAASRSCRHWHSWSTDNIQSSKTFQISLCTSLRSQSPAVGHYHIAGIAQTTAQRIWAISFLSVVCPWSTEFCLLDFTSWSSDSYSDTSCKKYPWQDRDQKVCCSSSILLQGETFD